jgi:PAS domain S-box-containing protein
VGEVQGASEQAILEPDRQLLEALLRSSRDAICLLDLTSGRAEFLNKRSFCGYTHDDVPWPESMLSAVHEEDAEAVAAHWRALSQGDLGASGAIEYRLHAKNGETEWIRSREIVLEDGANGRPTRLLVTLAVITERKRADAVLQEEQDRAQRILDVAGAMLVAFDRSGTVTMANQRTCEILETEETKIVGRDWIESFVPLERREDVRRLFAQLTDGSEHLPTVCESPVVTADGAVRTIAWQNVPLQDRDGTIVGILGSGLDITESRATKAALDAERDLTRILVESSPMFCVALDSEARVLMMNRSMLAALGYSEDEVIGTDYMARFVPEEDRAPIRSTFFQLAGARQSATIRGPILTRSGKRLLVEWHGSPMTNPGTDRVFFFGVGIDITDRVRTEQALRESEERLSSFMRSASDGFLLLDERLAVVDINDRGLEIIERTRDEILGRALVDVFRDAVPSARCHECLEVLRTEEPLEFEHAVRHPARSERRYVLKVFKAGNGLGVIASDVTQRVRNAEIIASSAERLRALRSRLAQAEEDERRRIARELHDQVSQNLTALSINISSVRNALAESEPQLARRLAESNELIEETADNIRNLTFDLRPPVLDDFGLVSAISWYAERVHAQTGLTVSIEGDDPTPRLASSTEAALFRIVQEALTNAAKHARASSATVRMTASGGSICLDIEDDGVGFASSDVARNEQSPGWGLLNMRERAEALGGTFTLDSERGSGTRIAIEVPR